MEAVGGRGPGGLPGSAPLRAGQRGVPASEEAGTRDPRRSFCGRCDCHAGRRAAGHGRRGGRREPVTAGSGPHRGSVPALAVFPGAGVGIVLIGAEERAGGPGMVIPFLSPSSRVCGGLGEAGPAAPLGATSSLGLSSLRNEGGGFLSRTLGRRQPASLRNSFSVPVAALSVFPA